MELIVELESNLNFTVNATMKSDFMENNIQRE